MFDPVKVSVSSGKLKTIEQRDVALLRHHITSEGKKTPEIAVAGGDHASEQRSRRRIIQQSDHLPRNGPVAIAVGKGRQDQNKRLVDGWKRLFFAPRNAKGRASETLDEAVCIAGCAREVDELNHCLNEGCDLVWPETGPVISANLDDRHLFVPERLNVIESLNVLAQINYDVINTLLVKRTVSCIALDTGRFAVNGNGHFFSCTPKNGLI